MGKACAVYSVDDHKLVQRLVEISIASLRRHCTAVDYDVVVLTNDADCKVEGADRIIQVGSVLDEFGFTFERLARTLYGARFGVMTWAKLLIPMLPELNTMYVRAVVISPDVIIRNGLVSEFFTEEFYGNFFLGCVDYRVRVALPRMRDRVARSYICGKLGWNSRLMIKDVEAKYCHTSLMAVDLKRLREGKHLADYIEDIGFVSHHMRNVGFDNAEQDWLYYMYDFTVVPQKDLLWFFNSTAEDMRERDSSIIPDAFSEVRLRSVMLTNHRRKDVTHCGITLDSVAKSLTDLNTEFVDKVCDRSYGPYGNVAKVKIGDGRVLVYVRAFGYRLFMKREDELPLYNGWSFFVADEGDFGEPRRLRVEAPEDVDVTRVEDIRLYRYTEKDEEGNGGLRAVMTYVLKRKTPSTKATAGGMVMALDLDLDEGVLRMREVYRSWEDKRDGVRFERVEKNWMPIAGRESRFVYKVGGNELRIFDSEGGVFHTVSNELKEELSGGPPCVELSNGHQLMLCHVRPHRFYAFFLVEITEDGKLVGMTPAFKFSKHGVEFCTYMGVDEDKGELEFIYTVNDEHTYRIVVSLEDLFKCTIKGAGVKKEG